MARKKPKGARGTPSSPDKVVMYLEVPPYLKEQMEALAVEHDRKLTGEAIQALKEYLARHDRWPPPEGGGA